MNTLAEQLGKEIKASIYSLHDENPRTPLEIAEVKKQIHTLTAAFQTT
jgi:hypothetical protein